MMPTFPSAHEGVKRKKPAPDEEAEERAQLAAQNEAERYGTARERAYAHHGFHVF